MSEPLMVADEMMTMIETLRAERGSWPSINHGYLWFRPPAFLASKLQFGSPKLTRKLCFPADTGPLSQPPLPTSKRSFSPNPVPKPERSLGTRGKDYFSSYKNIRQSDEHLAEHENTPMQ